MSGGCSSGAGGRGRPYHRAGTAKNSFSGWPRSAFAGLPGGGGSEVEGSVGPGGASSDREGQPRVPELQAQPWLPPQKALIKWSLEVFRALL